MKSMNAVIVIAGVLVWCPESQAEPPAAADDGPALTIEVRPVARDAKPVVPNFPSHYELFEKRIEEVEGKGVLDLMGSNLKIRLQKHAVLGGKKEPYAAVDFISAILRGRIIPDARMDYHLQRAEECLVTTPTGDFKVGIYYSPVGYIVLPNGECYWFLFDEKSKP